MAKFRGPAIIEEKESTVIVGEDASVSMDDFGFLWIDLSTAQKRLPKTQTPAKKKAKR
jgi:hypothetical protein